MQRSSPQIPILRYQLVQSRPATKLAVNCIVSRSTWTRWNLIDCNVVSSGSVIDVSAETVFYVEDFSLLWVETASSDQVEDHVAAEVDYVSVDVVTASGCAPSPRLLPGHQSDLHSYEQ
jgi:hypothetical protein